METNLNTPTFEESVYNMCSFLYAREDAFEGNWHNNLHTHRHAELFYITGGKGSFQFNTHSCEVSQDDLIVINSNIAHTEISDKENPLSYIVLGISGLETICDKNGNNEFFISKSLDNRNFILPIIKNILIEVESQQEYYKEICEHLFKSMLIYLWRQNRFVYNPLPSHNRRNSKECAAIRRYIDIHHKENLTLDDLANYAHINKYYLVHSFTKEYGISPINYLQFKRITESKRLLQETGLSVSQIAGIVGFASSSHFSQCFKRHTFTTPSKFRKISKKSHI